MAFPPPHHKLFPTFSSASSSCASEQSLGRGSCAAIFLQLFDWNCRHHRRRTFCRKSLPAERRSPTMVNDKACRDEHLPSEDSILGNKNNELLPENRGGSTENDALHTSEKKKKKKRAPNVVAKLMGLETMPSPEVINKRQPLNPWNLNTIPDSKVSYHCSDSSFRGRPVKLEKRMDGASEGHRWSSKHNCNGNGNELAGVQVSTARHQPMNPLISAMLSPLTEQNCISGSMPSPSKVYKPIVSPVEKTLASKNAVCLYENRNTSLPEPSTSARKACIVRSLVHTSTSAETEEEKNRKVKVEKKKAKHPNSSIDTGSKRRCVPCSFYHDSTSVQSLSEQEKKTLKEEEIISTPTCLKRQRVSANHGCQSHILPQLRTRHDRKVVKERACTSMVQTASKKRGHISSGKNTSHRDEIMQRLMQGKSAQGKDYAKCHHDASPGGLTGVKPKLAKVLHQKNDVKDESSLALKLQQDKSDNPRESTEKSKDSCTSNNRNVKNDKLSCRSGKQIRDSSPLLKSLLIKRAAARSALDELEISTQEDSATSVKESNLTSIEESHTTSIEESEINSTDENVVISKQKRGANPPGLESFDADIDNGSSASCVTEEVQRAEDMLSTHSAESKFDATTQEECCNGQNSYLPLGYDRTGNEEEMTRFCHSEIAESGCQSMCKSSIEEVKDTASASSSQKIQPVSYSGKSTAIILHELLMSLNLSMEQSRIKEEDNGREKSSKHSQPALGSNTFSNLRTGENSSFDANGDNYRGYYSDNCSASIFIPHEHLHDRTEVLGKLLSTGKEKHTLRECSDKCWGQASYLHDESNYLLIHTFSSPREKHVEDGATSFIHPKANNIIQTEEAYINRIVSNVHLLPYVPYSPALGFNGTLIDSSLFFKLEKDAKHMWNSGFNEPKVSSNNDDMRYRFDEATRAYRKLVFDCVKEAIDLDIQRKSCVVEYHPSSPTSYMAMGIHKKLDDWKRMTCGMNVDDMVENSMNTGCGKWIDFSQEVSEVSMKVETQIFSHLIDELVMDMMMPF